MATIKEIARKNSTTENTIKMLRAFERASGLHITMEHTGKMEGMMSLSTDCGINPICMARIQARDSICINCYANRMFNKDTGMYRHSHCFEDNYHLIQENGDVIPVPDLNGYPFFRGESFGDSATWKHPYYFIRMAQANPKTNIALWTKNPWFVKEAVERMGLKRKPSNLQIIYSSPKLNECDLVTAEKYKDVIDTVFTVYSPEYLAKHPEVKINCGALNCRSTCHCKCYKRNHSKGFRIVNERLK